MGLSPGQSLVSFAYSVVVVAASCELPFALASVVLGLVVLLPWRSARGVSIA